MSRKNSNPIIRASGQRSIPSTLLFRPLNNCLEKRKGESNLSLTSFLNRKLNTSPIYKASKETSIPLDDNGANGSYDTKENHSFAKPHEGKTCVIEESVFKLFNNSEEKVRKRSSECMTDGNGTGWWNSERGGVDNDEVGHKEVWEGVGSTTLGVIGGLEWSSLSMLNHLHPSDCHF